MSAQNFSKKEAIKFGWQTMKSNLGFFIGLLLLVFVINIGPGLLTALVLGKIPLLSFVFAVISWVLQIIIGIGLIKIALKFCGNEKGEFSDLFSSYPLFFKYLFGSILYGLIVFGGLILLIIPGIIWSIKYQFYLYFIVDKGLGPIESLKKSGEITKGVKWNLFLFGLLLAGINILGVLALLIGMFAAIPTTMVATAFVYRKLLTQIESSQPPAEPSL
ncbi:MAG: hypothetical protein A3A94_02665 [Candidatus Portnoybacteria bacterium RIFCSPLOWO2_01_FULL_43_11]|uniref:Glycerophosphoryl diester phosphodiesterase membrane domain-containing protein n=4 Tax=Candidatus Portnoyibacteriota TaxID=1817913 RepID=A0A1G2FD32_9BACT|nr:MAG: hypothetical protein A2815_00635 [Candidatus Portnoybacteria bacterium RIFCSPHIGHO2_01_FULL_40_12b]OGZ38700.1 MAG: hypothetical protein A3A94_02665 [Candidatus Portnoybacteria bacterium RIFCSPLOWO2_01_FULL_43_11]OGZ38750.1 MAG: hypothetical protein A3E90_03370 [Candidatus Portnoybacteria bacterium RIFCSPHIGHO2_12_FULL_40_11]